MKKILIATDFSVAADDAARYAIELARKIRTDTILINAAAVTTDSPLEILWPMEDYQTLIKRTDIRLKDLSAVLLDSTTISVESANPLPKIGIKSDLGSVTDLLRVNCSERRYRSGRDGTLRLWKYETVSPGKQ